MKVEEHENMGFNIENRRYHSATLLNRPNIAMRGGEAHGKVPDHTQLRHHTEITRT